MKSLELNMRQEMYLFEQIYLVEGTGYACAGQLRLNAVMLLSERRVKSSRPENFGTELPIGSKQATTVRCINVLRWIGAQRVFPTL